MVVGGGLLDVAGGAAAHGRGCAEALLVVALVASRLVTFFSHPPPVFGDFGAAGGLRFVGRPVGAVLFVPGGDADDGVVEAAEMFGAGASGGLVEVEAGFGTHVRTPRLIRLLLTVNGPVGSLRRRSNVGACFRWGVICDRAPPGARPAPVTAPQVPIEVRSRDGGRGRHNPVRRVAG